MTRPDRAAPSPSDLPADSERSPDRPAEPPATVSALRRRWWLVVGLGLAVFVLVYSASGLLEAWEGAVFDRLMRLRPARTPDDVVVVAIDSDAIDQQGRWPWSRSLMARLIERIVAAEPAVVGLDIVFSETSRNDEVCDLTAEDEELAATIAEAGNVVLAYFSAEQPDGSAVAPATQPPELFELDIPQEGFPGAPCFTGLERSLDLFTQSAADEGFANKRTQQGVVRSYHLTAALVSGEADEDCGERDIDFHLPALALTLAAAKREELPVLDSYGELPRIDLGGEPVRTGLQGALWLNFRGPEGTIETISAARLLPGEEWEPAEEQELDDLLRGKVVLVGGSEPGLFDRVETPLGSEMPGVEVHATAVSNLLAGDALRYGGAQDTLSFLALLLLPVAVALLVAAIRPNLRGAIAALALLAAWLAIAAGAFFLAAWHLQIVFPLAAGAISLVATLTYQVGVEERTTRRLRKYLPPDVAREIARNPSLGRFGGPRRELTVLFADIRGFTSIAETMPSEQVGELLNRFHTAMTQVVFDHGGTLDKYMGDGVMVLFGAPIAHPDHAARACRAAMAMIAATAELDRDEWFTDHLPEGARLRIGVGLNTGYMTVGDMGSDQLFDYTAVGNEVNLGSRIEGLNKLYGTEILLAALTVKLAGEGFLCREIDRVRVKGKQVPVTLCELLAATPAPAELTELASRFAQGLELYRERSFTAAERQFAALCEDYPDDAPSALYRKRCRQLREDPPPEEWDAVENLTVK